MSFDMHNFRNRFKRKCKNAKISITTPLLNVVAHIHSKQQSKISKKAIITPQQESIFDIKSTALSLTAYDKLAWIVGTKVLLHSYQNNRIYECIIEKISKPLSSNPSSYKPDLTDRITIKYENGSTETFNRFDDEIKSHPVFITNRKKLTRYCTIDRYSVSENQWIAEYIDNWGKLTESQRATNGNIFSVNGRNYGRWSHKIRCLPSLLNLVEGAMIFIFDCHINAWCYGKIRNILCDKNNKNTLDIFKVHYQKNGKIYLKYIHQFSASIAMLDDSIYTESRMNENDIDLKSATTVDLHTADLTYYRLLLQGVRRKGLRKNEDPFINNDVVCILIKYIGHLQKLDVYMDQEDIQSATTIDTDKTDLKYYRLLLQGIRRTKLKQDEDVFINKDVLSIMVKYIGWKYELVMAIESKTWSFAIANKEENMTPKYSTIHDGRYLPLCDLSSNDTPIPSECSVDRENISNTEIQNNRFKVKTSSVLEMVDEDGFVILEEEEQPISDITENINPQNTTLDPNAASFVSIKTQNNNDITSVKKRKKKQHNPYRSNIIQMLQTNVRIPHKLTNTANECIKENIFDVFHYMLTMNALQFIEDEKKEDDTKIFNYNLHDKNTGNILYGIAKREDIRNYKWCMLTKLFSAEQILNEWNISQRQLPQIPNFRIVDKERIYSLLMNKDKFKQIIKATNWCKVRVFNRVNNITRMILKITKEEFVNKYIEFVNKENNINLIPILIFDDRINMAQIEYLYILQLVKNGVVDIGISFKYDDKTGNVRVSAIHITPKEYIINQHQLIDPDCKCKYLDSFRSGIDDINIGNPDDDKNQLNAAKNMIQKLKKRIKQLQFNGA